MSSLTPCILGIFLSKSGVNDEFWLIGVSIPKLISIIGVSTILSRLYDSCLILNYRCFNDIIKTI